jgi:hypothetical protein
MLTQHLYPFGIVTAISVVEQFDWLCIGEYVGSMSDTQLTRLGDFISGAGSTVLVVAVASPRWWIVLAGLLLMAIAMGLYVVQYRGAQSSKPN